jgi:hypothetical protein
MHPSLRRGETGNIIYLFGINLRIYRSQNGGKTPDHMNLLPLHEAMDHVRTPALYRLRYHGKKSDEVIDATKFLAEISIN